MWFEALSGLKINLEKSELILVGEVPNMEELVGILGCRVGTILTVCLGFFLGAPSSLVWFRKGWKTVFRNSLLFGRDSIFQRGKR